MLLELHLDIYAVVYVRFIHFKLHPGDINSAVTTCFKLIHNTVCKGGKPAEKWVHQALSSRNLQKSHKDQEISVESDVKSFQLRPVRK